MIQVVLFLSLFLLMPSFSCFAQNDDVSNVDLVDGDLMQTPIDSIADDSVLVKTDWGVYASVEARQAPILGDRLWGAALGCGIRYKSISLQYIYASSPQVKGQVVFPSSFRLEAFMQGFAMRYQSFEIGGKLHGAFEASYMSGEMVWVRESNNESLQGDQFYSFLGAMELGFLRPQIGFFEPYAKLGYQNVAGLSLQDVPPSSVSGMYIVIGLRIGYFNQ